MSEVLRKRYAIKVLKSAEEQMISKAQLYGFDFINSLNSMADYFARYNTNIVESGKEKIVLFDADPQNAPVIIKCFLFFGDGKAKQIQLNDEEMVCWEEPDKTYLLRFKEPEIQRLIVGIENRLGRHIPRGTFTVGYDIGRCWGIFAFTTNCENNMRIQCCRLFVNQVNAQRVVGEINEMCGGNVEILESSDAFDYNIRISKKSQEHQLGQRECVCHDILKNVGSGVS